MRRNRIYIIISTSFYTVKNCAALVFFLFKIFLYIQRFQLGVLLHSPLVFPFHLTRQGQLIFENGQRQLELDFSILPDATPERDEAFTVRIYNASGKAIVNSQKQDLTINILSNDGAFGRIGFAADSLNRVQPETGYDSVVTFEVIREYGSLGRVVAQWNVSGNFSDGDLSPLSGELVFEDGQVSQNISITVHKDAVPELLEVAYVR